MEDLMLDGYPALITVTLTNNGVVTYKENLPFRSEPVDEEVIEFIKFIRPSTKHNYLICDYIRPLNPNEK